MLSYRRMQFLSSLSFAAVVLVLCTGCGFKYTVQIDSSLQNNKIQPSTIAVFPVEDLHYAPPSGGCIPTSGSDISSGKEKSQSYWNTNVKSTLKNSFYKQKWVFLDSVTEVLQSGNVDFGAVRELSRQSFKAYQISVSKSDVIEYVSMGDNAGMRVQLQKLKELTGADYAVVFIKPMLSGAIQTSYSSNGMGGSSMQSTTYYTADIKVLVWECSTGKLLFSSGGWKKSGSSCMLMDPRQMSIQGADAKFKKNLQLIIARLMNYDAEKNIVQVRAQ